MSAEIEEFKIDLLFVNGVYIKLLFAKGPTLDQMVCAKAILDQVISISD